MLVADYLSVAGHKGAGVTACIVLLRDLVSLGCSGAVGLILGFSGYPHGCQDQGFYSRTLPFSQVINLVAHRCALSSTCLCTCLVFVVMLIIIGNCMLRQWDFHTSLPGMDFSSNRRSDWSNLYLVSWRQSWKWDSMSVT